RRPVERHPVARTLLERRAVGGDRLLETRRPALPRPEPRERIAEVVLGRRPVERHPTASPFRERRAEGGDRLLQTHRPPLPLPERPEAGGDQQDNRDNYQERNGYTKTSPPPLEARQGLIRLVEEALLVLGHTPPPVANVSMLTSRRRNGVSISPA